MDGSYVNKLPEAKMTAGKLGQYILTDKSDWRGDGCLGGA